MRSSDSKRPNDFMAFFAGVGKEQPKFLVRSNGYLHA